jgi:hypothetical protein
LGGSRELQVADEAARPVTGASGIGPGIGRRSRRRTCYNVRKVLLFLVSQKELGKNFRYNGGNAPLSSVNRIDSN